MSERDSKPPPRLEIYEIPALPTELSVLYIKKTTDLCTRQIHILNAWKHVCPGNSSIILMYVNIIKEVICPTKDESAIVYGFLYTKFIIRARTNDITVKWMEVIFEMINFSWQEKWICLFAPVNWAGWVRTSECGSQSPMPYHLATAQYRVLVCTRCIINLYILLLALL